MAGAEKHPRWKRVTKSRLQRLPSPRREVLEAFTILCQTSLNELSGALHILGAIEPGDEVAFGFMRDCGYEVEILIRMVAAGDCIQTEEHLKEQEEARKLAIETAKIVAKRDKSSQSVLHQALDQALKDLDKGKKTSDVTAAITSVIDDVLKKKPKKTPPPPTRSLGFLD